MATNIFIVAFLLILVFSANANEVVYDYDSLNRLTLVKYDDSNIIHYTYDAAGNRTKMLRIGPDNPDLDSDGDGVPDRLELMEYGDLHTNEMKGVRDFLLGRTSDSKGLDVNSDGKVDIADLVSFKFM